MRVCDLFPLNVKMLLLLQCTSHIDQFIVIDEDYKCVSHNFSNFGMCMCCRAYFYFNV